MKIQIISGFERSKRGARNAKALEALSTRVDEFMPPCQRGLCMPVFYGVLASSLQTVFPASVEHGNPVTHQSFSDTATTRISQATTQILLAFQVSCLYFSIGDLAIHQTDGIADEIWPPFPARRWCFGSSRRRIRGICVTYWWDGVDNSCAITVCSHRVLLPLFHIATTNNLSLAICFLLPLLLHAQICSWSFPEHIFLAMRP